MGVLFRKAKMIKCITYTFVIALALMCIQGSASASEAPESSEFSITGQPVWYKVGSKPVEVRALATHRPLGTLNAGTPVLSFGVTKAWITFAYQGTIAYAPAGDFEEMYPVQKIEPAWRGYGPSLEDQVKKTREELVKLAHETELLNPELKKTKPGEAGQGAVAAGGGGPLPGVQNAVRNKLTPARGRGGGYY